MLASLLAWWIAPFLDVEFSKVMSRAVLLFAGLGLLPLWRAAGLDAEAVGLRGAAGQGSSTRRASLTAFVAAIGMVIPLALFFLVVGFRIPDPRVEIFSFDFATLFLLIGVGAVLAGILEEVLFRGVLLAVIERAAGFAIAAISTSAIYASVHFLERGEVELVDPQWFSGLQLLGSALGDMFSLNGQWDAWIALFLLGLLLCGVRRAVGLWPCVALHAGWILAIRLFKELTVRDVVNPYRSWTSDFDNFIGWLAVFWLLFCFVVIALFRRHRSKASPPPA